MLAVTTAVKLLAEIALLALGQPGKARKVISHLGCSEPRVAAQLERENAVALAAAGGVADAAH